MASTMGSRALGGAIVAGLVGRGGGVVVEVVVAGEEGAALVGWVRVFKGVSRGLFRLACIALDAIVWFAVYLIRVLGIHHWLPA